MDSESFMQSEQAVQMTEQVDAATAKLLAQADTRRWRVEFH